MAAKAIADSPLTVCDVHIELFGNDDKEDLIKLIRSVNFEYPMDVYIKRAGSSRSDAQNALQMLWFREAGRQGDQKAWEYRAYCKLHFGVPIMRRDNKAYSQSYDEHVRPVKYESKLVYMVDPWDFPVTRLFTKRQMSEYLDLVYEHLTGLGIKLSQPTSQI